MNSNRTGYALLIAGLIATVVVFFSQLHAPFYRDDAAHIELNRALQAPTSITDFYSNSTLGTTRYLSATIMRGAWKLSEGKPWGFHLTSLLLHLANALVLFSLLMALKTNVFPGAAAALLFLLHPIQVNPVLYASKIPVLLSSLFILSALYVAARSKDGKEPWVLVILLTTFGVMAKEIAAFTPLLVLLLRYAIAEKLPHKSIAGYLALFILATLTTATLNKITNQASYGFHVQTPYEYFLTQMYNGWRYLGLLVFALSRSHIHPHPLFTPTVWLYGVAFMLCSAIALYFLLKPRATRKLHLFWILFFIILLLPTHSFIPKRTAFAEYQFYLVNAAIFALVGNLVWHWLQNRSWRAYATGATTAILFLSFVSYKEVQHWRDPFALASQGVNQYPKDSSAFKMLAEHARQNGDPVLARKYLLEFMRLEHQYYRQYSIHEHKAKLDFIALEAAKDVYEIELNAARKAFPEETFPEFSEPKRRQVDAREIIGLDIE